MAGNLEVVQAAGVKRVKNFLYRGPGLQYDRSTAASSQQSSLGVMNYFVNFRQGIRSSKVFVHAIVVSEKYVSSGEAVSTDITAGVSNSMGRSLLEVLDQSVQKKSTAGRRPVLLVYKIPSGRLVLFFPEPAIIAFCSICTHRNLNIHITHAVGP